MSTYSICNIRYDNELNNRIHKRVFPSQELQPNFNPIPVSTKYTLFQTNELHNNSNDDLRPYNKFDNKKIFYPGNSKGPTAFFFDNVDTESTLRNQYFALQKNDKAYYIPDIKSDLYNHRGNLINKPSILENAKVSCNNSNMNINLEANLAPNIFNNTTKDNVKNI